MVGVAVAVPQPHATVLTKWRKQVGDPSADLVWPHITLLPPTPVDASSLADVEAHLARAATAQQPFVMHLSGTGTFRPTSSVVFIQVATGLAQCEVLEQAIRTGPLGRDLEFPYHPHVTVAQGIDDTSLDEAYNGLSGFDARFPVEKFALFCREASGRWVWRSEYHLGDATI
jgi:2'-5' RNA ligase